MKIFKKRLNSQGFSHIELGFVLLVIAGIVAVGYWVIKHDNANAANTYTTLTPIRGGGHVFTEQVCISATTPAHSSGGVVSPASAVITALISVGKKAGYGTGYNPLAYYTIGTGKAVTEDKWTSGKTSYISFNLPSASVATKFQLGVEAKSGSTKKFNGTSQLIGSIASCNPVPVTSPTAPKAPTVSISASPTTVKASATSKLT